MKTPAIYRRWTVFGFLVLGFLLCVFQATKPHLIEGSPPYIMQTILSFLTIGIWSLCFYNIATSLIKIAGLIEDGFDSMIRLNDLTQKQTDIVNQHRLGMISYEEANKAMNDLFCEFSAIAKWEHDKMRKDHDV